MADRLVRRPRTLLMGALRVAETGLIGGGLEHYSWVRFALPKPGSSAVAWILDGKGLWSNAPLWPCNGKTSWSFSAKAGAVQLHFPSPKCNGSKSILLNFANPVAAVKYPKGAKWSVMAATTPPLSGFKFPDDQCDVAMTSCKDPFK